MFLNIVLICIFNSFYFNMYPVDKDLKHIFLTIIVYLLKEAVILTFQKRRCLSNY